MVTGPPQWWRLSDSLWWHPLTAWPAFGREYRRHNSDIACPYGSFSIRR